MKFNCGPTLRERWRNRRQRQIDQMTIAFEKNSKWQDIYAWLPTRVATGDCRWLEVIQYRDRCAAVYYPNHRQRAVRMVREGWTSLDPVWEYRAKETN